MKYRIPLLFTCLLMSNFSQAEDFSSLIKERQEGFEDMGAAMKTFREGLKESDLDIMALKEAASTFTELGPKIHDWFPAGSGPESGLETDALPYIWKNPEKFSGITDDLTAAAGELATAVEGGNKGAIASGVAALGKACKACHQSYRAD